MSSDNKFKKTSNTSEHNKKLEEVKKIRGLVKPCLLKMHTKLETNYGKIFFFEKWIPIILKKLKSGS